MTSEVTLTLAEVEAYCEKNGIAGSALGRFVCQDQALMSRWRRGGCTGVSDRKRLLLQCFIIAHPDGHPGITKKGHRHKVFGRVGFSPSAMSKTDRRFEGPYTKPSTPLPVPGVEELRKENIAWVKARASQRHVPLVVVLAEMVELGIALARELEHEEAQAIAEDSKHG